ncbi:hypothetical protein BCR43DRAFT_484967 [Syncephalastrum racemosum]|uniref:RRM domain-containing protein n=1 Tax=Syncephalastrum racemosum TaxID=13706 RepID=A0A1X2HLK8_SYNRA|nr:hypothetical protein BCR43DRAFT_484967 [Syncephalastrum racemosum]
MPSANDNRKTLYVGNLDQRVVDYMLREIFSAIGPVKHVKIIAGGKTGSNYGFIEFFDHYTAEQALETMNGRRLFGHDVRVNWAVQGASSPQKCHIFVGDLGPDVSDQVLSQTFGIFHSMADARVMWDLTTGHSRGFGFVSFRDRSDAEQAIATMNGERLGSRAMRVNWANQKTPAHCYSNTNNITTNNSKAARLSNIPGSRRSMIRH